MGAPLSIGAPCQLVIVSSCSSKIDILEELEDDDNELSVILKTWLKILLFNTIKDDLKDSIVDIDEIASFKAL